MNKFSNFHYYSASDFFKERFGFKVYKISLDAGCTCPNRDGTKGKGGCIFCSSKGSGDFATDKNLDIETQVEKAKKLVKDKCKSNKYIAYFQNYTNTYGNIDELYNKWESASLCSDIVGVSIATRPDCVNENVCEHLKKLAQKTFVIVELGLQSSKKITQEELNLKYSNTDYINAVKLLHRICPEIHIITHLIIALPGESLIDMKKSVEFCVKNKTDGIKLSLLHVLKNTVLEQKYLKGEFRCPEMLEYFKILASLISIIPKSIVIHRVTGDGYKGELVSPLWTSNKKLVLNSMNEYFKEIKLVQGRDLSL